MIDMRQVERLNRIGRDNHKAIQVRSENGKMIGKARGEAIRFFPTSCKNGEWYVVEEEVASSNGKSYQVKKCFLVESLAYLPEGTDLSKIDDAWLRSSTMGFNSAGETWEVDTMVKI